MSIPYSPTPFAQAIFNPAIGGSGTPYPYLSVSEYQYAPTAVDVTGLYPQGSPEDQEQSLFNTIQRASSAADQYVFGADPAAKGASLCATLSVESAFVPIVRGELRLVCDYKPIIQVNGIDIGPTMAALNSVGPTIASSVRIGRRTVYVPLFPYAVRPNDTGNPNPYVGRSGNYMAVWSYVNGYPHTELVGSITAGTRTCNVLATDGGTGLFGIIPNQTQMTLVDGSYTERFTVASVSGTTLTSTTNFTYNHTAPTAPDFIPVTTLPSAVSLAVIFLTTAIIKTEGDAALVLNEMNEPKTKEAEVGGMSTDVLMAKELLHPFKVNTKQKT